MARKPNYDYEKRRKEQDRKARKDAKRADRQQRRDESQPEDEANGEGAQAPAPTTPDEAEPRNVPPAV